jgi:hypothetical protein
VQRTELPLVVNKYIKEVQRFKVGASFNAEDNLKGFKDNGKLRYNLK